MTGTTNMQKHTHDMQVNLDTSCECQTWQHKMMSMVTCMLESNRTSNITCNVILLACVNSCWEMLSKKRSNNHHSAEIPFDWYWGWKNAHHFYIRFYDLYQSWYVFHWFFCIFVLLSKQVERHIFENTHAFSLAFSSASMYPCMHAFIHRWWLLPI